MIKRLSLIIAGLLCLLGVMLPTALPAQAVNGLTGVCQSGTSSCWRVTPYPPSGAPVDLWARDISGDLGQDWIPWYEGALNDQIADLCNPNHLSWINNYWDEGVYFFSNNTGPNYEVTSPGNKVQVTLDHKQADYFWIWTPQGNLINCANSDYWNAPQGIGYTSNYHQLMTSGSGWAPWQQIDPPARHR
jgi:hypothetical protein